MTTLPQTTSVRMPRPSNGAAITAPGPVGAPYSGGSGAAAGGGFNMTGADVWRVIRTNLWLILAVLLLSTLVGGGLYYYLLKKHASYTASGYIQIQPLTRFDLSRPVTPELNQQALAIEQRTQAQLLTSEGLLARLFSNPNKAIRETSWFQQFADEPNPVAEAKRDLVKRMDVRAIPDSKLLQVSMSYKDPKEAATIVNDIVSEHLDGQRSENVSKVQQQTLQYQGARRKYVRERDDVLMQIREHATQLSIDGAGTPGRLIPQEEELRQLIRAHFDIQKNARDAREQYESVVEQQQNGVDPPVVEELINRDQEVAMLRQVLTNIDVQIAGMANLGESHREVLKAKAERETIAKKLEEVRAGVRTTATAQIVEQARLMKEATESQVEEMGKRIAAATTALGDLQYKMTQYLTLRDQEEVYRLLIQKVDERLDELDQSARAQDFSSVSWAQRPETPDRPSFPKIPIVVGGCIALGLTLSLGLAFLREVLDTSVRSPRDIARVGQLTLLGMIPHEDEDPQSAGVPLATVIFQSPHSMMAEQFRQVRTRLQHAAALDSTKSILVTSPGPQDGKSMVAANLAAGLALNGRRILLVDGNFRRPEIHKIFNLSNETGFSTALSSLESFAETVQQTQVPNLDVLPSGPKPANATELLESQLLIDFIERALEEYDHVIFDSGPLLVVSETVALAPRVDGVITVVRARNNSRGLLQRMRDSLRQIKAENLGVVLNAVRAQAGGYYNRSMKTYYAYQNGHGA
ncbi:MAG TPA: polysaccharide biosynthesis tyrosine autokinase [Tepidisphaeraceae bacterium]|nr:polysaccharide biosynthesis tyrosine autokinase [Tepidisphaeraceae bacterium]